MADLCVAQQTAVFALAATLGSVVFLGVLVLLHRCHSSIAHASRYPWLRKSRDGLRLRSSNELPTLPPLANEKEYHLFISHTWRTGQDQPAAMKAALQQALPKAKPKIFLDVDDLDDLTQLETHIASSKVVLLFLSKGYFLSRACLLEVRACMQHDKPLMCAAGDQTLYLLTSIWQLTSQIRPPMIHTHSAWSRSAIQ